MGTGDDIDHIKAKFLSHFSFRSSKWGFNLGRLVDKVMVETKIVNEFMYFEF